VERAVAPHSQSGRSGAPLGLRTGDAGQVVYLILEDRREVHLLVVQWLG